MRFLDELRKIYANVPFLEALKEEPSYLKFLRELLSKQGKLEKAATIPVREVCSVVLQSKSPSMVQDLGNFLIPYSIGDP